MKSISLFCLSVTVLALCVAAAGGTGELEIKPTGPLGPSKKKVLSFETQLRRAKEDLAQVDGAEEKIREDELNRLKMAANEILESDLDKIEKDALKEIDDIRSKYFDDVRELRKRRNVFIEDVERRKKIAMEKRQKATVAPGVKNLMRRGAKMYF